MILPAIPANEQQRLECLHAPQLLDTPVEPVFDRITRLAMRALGVPIALVSLVDSTRQWAKSVVGPVSCEISRDISFCAHAVGDDATLVVPDARLDARFADNPLVPSVDGIRFYAGVPLKTSTGLSIGTLCVADRTSRSLLAEELAVLEDAADLVVEEIRRREAVLVLNAQTDRAAVALQESEALFRSVS